MTSTGRDMRYTETRIGAISELKISELKSRDRPDCVSAVILTDTKLSNQPMKPTAPLRSNFSVFATTPCRGLSLSR